MKSLFRAIVGKPVVPLTPGMKRDENAISRTALQPSTPMSGSVSSEPRGGISPTTEDLTPT